MAKTTTLAPPDPRALPLFNDEEARQFVLQIGTQRARMEYDRSSDRVFLTGMVVPKDLVALGVSAILTEKVLNWIEGNKLKLVPMCADVKAYLVRHPQWKRLLVKGLHI